ncbi:tetratricopeptide repeat protein [Parasalinivibrio latis]|uniref:tetratricopeptide repeat protein n=1 Tax=Parasalinivibrio latis TaxID=2952610 RepID=UPI0030E0D224
MSELNRMLKDLAPESGKQAGSLKAAEIKPLPSNRRPAVLFALVALLTLLAGGYLALDGNNVPKANTAPVAPPVNEPVFDEDAELAAKNEPVVERAEPQVAAPVVVSPTHKRTETESVQLTAIQAPIKDSGNLEPEPTGETKPVVSEAEKAAGEEGIQPLPEQNAAKPPVLPAESKPVPAPVTQQKSEPLKVVRPPETAMPEATEKPETVISDSEGLTIKTVSLSHEQLAEVELEKATKYRSEGDSRRAIKHLETALKYQPDRRDIRQGLASLYYGRGDVRTALNVLQEGLSRDDPDGLVRLTLAKLLVSESQTRAALQTLKTVPVAASTEFMAVRGALAQQLKESDIALNSYEMLVKAEPYDGRWWMGLGIALERLEKGDKAKDAYQQALSLGRISGKSQQFIQQRLAALQRSAG